MATRNLVFIPTYNERENVEPILRQILALGVDTDILFVDDDSPDGTGKLLDSLSEANPRMKVIHRSGKLGIGSAHLAGIEYAYAERYERLVTMDCDFTHSPALIPKFLAKADDADVVVGSRFLSEGSLPGWTIARRALTRLGHFLTESTLGVSQDATGAFRVYNLQTVPREMFGLVKSRGYSFFFESMLVFNLNGLAISELPITLSARAAGHSKMSIAEIRRSLGTLGSLLIETRTNPARFLLSGCPSSATSGTGGGRRGGSFGPP